MRGAVLVVLLLAACTQRSYVECADGRICPENTVCEDTRKLCISNDQRNACSAGSGTPTGWPCTADDRPGICTDDHLCLSGCGDGVTNSDLGEECDDGNFASHDGCSSQCLDETPQWVRVPDKWTGWFAHSAAYFEPSGTLVAIGGTTDTGERTDQWERAPFPTAVEAAGWKLSTKQPPPSRAYASIVFDPDRGKLVMFGGVTVAIFDETWEYDQNGWVLKTPSTKPPARFGAMMVYDATAKKMVLFGGQGPSGILGDTWEYDGSTWKQVATPAPPAAPTGRAYSAMAWDSARGRAVLFGGLSNAGVMADTWEYAAQTWTKVTTTTQPDARFFASIAYYAPRTNPPRQGRVILFGGQSSGQAALSDTWAYTAAGWAPIQSAQNPPNRFSAAMDFMGYSADFIVLVGGAAGLSSQPLEDVWELHEDQWSEHSPRFEPRARFHASSAYDDARGEMMLLGGAIGSSILNDAWAYEDSGWSTMNISGQPQVQGHASAYDPKRGVIVVFGGIFAGTPQTNRTYEFQFASSTWSQKSPSTSPPARFLGALAYDDSEITLFGGTDDKNVSLADTWEWDGTTWSDHTAPPGMGPAASIAPAATYDPVHHRMVVFDTEGDTWAYANHAWSIVARQSMATPSKRYNAMLSFDYQRRHILLVGGEYLGTTFTDVWELDGDAWTKIAIPAGGPLPRMSATFTSNARQRATFLVGGRGAGGVFGDTWIFQYRSSTPDEVCDAENDDDDGDLHLDSEDPDCCSHHEPPTCGL